MVVWGLFVHINAVECSGLHASSEGEMNTFRFGTRLILPPARPDQDTSGESGEPLHRFSAPAACPTLRRSSPRRAWHWSVRRAACAEPSSVPRRLRGGRIGRGVKVSAMPTKGARTKFPVLLTCVANQIRCYGDKRSLFRKCCYSLASAHNC